MILKRSDSGNILELTKGSSRKVLIKCDDCSIVFETIYRNVVATNGRWCNKCCHMHKKKAIYDNKRRNELSELAKKVHTGRVKSEETKRKIGDSNRKSIKDYTDLFKINDRILYDKINCRWVYKCNECGIFFNLTIHQVGEIARQCKRANKGNCFCSEGCRVNYLKKNFSHTFFKKGYNLGGTSWNKGLNFSEETKKKISIGFGVNLERHRYNMRVAAINRIQKLKEEGKILSYPNRGANEIKCINELRHLLTNYEIITNKEFFGYFVDAYIPDINLSIEFDERHHYRYNSDGLLVLSERDKKRQKEIQNFNGCDFFRISEIDWEQRKEEIKIELTNKIKCLEYKIHKEISMTTVADSSEFVLGDDSNLSIEKKQVVDKIVQDTVNEIAQVGKITEDDRKKGQQKQAKIKTEEEEIAQMSSDLSEFLAEKIGIVNDGGGNIEKFPTGIDLLDAVAGGGFGVGTFTMICGSPGTFKSALLAQTIAAGQKKFNGRMFATYHDAEVAMSGQRLQSMGVVRPPVEPYTDVTIESIFKTIEGLCSWKETRGYTDIPSVVAWDSIANTETAKARTTDDINATIGLKARMLSQLFPRYLPKMKQHKISLIAINQLREKLDMGMFSAPSDLQHMGNKDIPGGQAVKFNAFHLLFLRNRGDLKFEQYGFNGIKLEAFFIKNKFFRPYVPVTLLVDFNSGISNFWTNYNFLSDCKKMQTGAWNFLLSLPEKKFRTKDALELYNTDVKFKAEFDKGVKESIQTDIINKAKGSSSTPVSTSAE